MCLLTGRSRFAVKNGSERQASVNPDPQDTAQSLGDFWNWSVLDVSRPIVKAGRLFIKRGPRKQFKLGLLS